MECQECHENKATLHFTQVINGEKQEIYVCEDCAKEKGYMLSSDEGYNFHDLLSGLFNYKFGTIGNNQASVKQTEELKCSKCDLTFTEFRRIGKFGCAICYETFSNRLDSVFRRVHSGNTIHHGKIPKRKGGHLHVKKEIDELKKELTQLITDENFEEAAEIRDRIRALREQESSELREGDSE